MKKILFICLLSIGIISCSKDDAAEDDVEDPIVAVDPTVKDAASLMAAMKIPGAIIKDGNIPVPAGVYADNIESMPSTVVVTSNSLFTIPIKTNITGNRIPTMVFIKLAGATKYYQINLDATGNPINTRLTDRRIRLNCTGGPNVELVAQPAGQQSSYENVATVYTYSPPLQSSPSDLSFLSNPQYWSAGYQFKFKALDVGTGDVQISLTWDTKTDVDLLLIEPNGNKIYYANKNSSTGGALDFDNVVEYGPENIFYRNVAPSGTYKVQVDYFSGAPTPTHFNVVVKKGNAINTYEGDLTFDNQVVDVVTFTK